MLGPVRVLGGAEPFRRAAALDLVVYLAFHRGGSANADWPSAVWLDRTVASATVHSTASDARRALGRHVDGTELISRGRHLLLHPEVSTDVDRFKRLIARGDPLSTANALRLVRGPVFHGLDRADWAVFDGTRAAVVALVVDAALRAGDGFVRDGQSAQATWAVRRGLLIDPFDERLYRALLRATAARPDRVGLRTTMEELLKLARAGNPPETIGSSRRVWEDAVHPDTAALYRDLLRGAPATG